MSYLEKRKKILKQQKKRDAERKKKAAKTIGIEQDIVRTRAKKSKSSKLGSAQSSKGSKNPTSSFQDMKKKDIKKSTFFQDVVAGPKLKKKKLGAVDFGLAQALNKKRATGMSPGALGGKAKPKPKASTSKNMTKSAMGAKTFKDYKTIAAAKKAGSLYYMGKDGKKKAAVTASDLKKSGLSLRDFLNFKLGKIRKGK
tara:strand:+ start:721 stop:1314 length:594 start_codon:yes stop_codon:yes gene_type:complete